MKLYDIREEDAIEVIQSGKKEILEEGKIAFVETLNNYNYPLKAVCKIIENKMIVVTSYLLKKRMKDENRL